MNATPVNADIKSVKINESFFSRLMTLAAERIIPYQWEALNDRIPDAAPSYCIRNFRAAAHMVDAEHAGCVFQDSDLAKWIEAVSYMLNWKSDPEAEKHIDECVDIMEKAQLEDGYLDTYYILKDKDERWTNLRDNHELYCLGHLLEGAVAYYQATGKRKFLDIMIKYVDCVDKKFGHGEGQIPGYPGHEEIELALIKLYKITGDEKHLRLAKYFIDERGAAPLYFDSEPARKTPGWRALDSSVYSGNRYFQASKPVREQDKALGHAVRQGYLLSGMADVARETGDETLKQACITMWNDIVRRQMYITGAVGQSAFGEAFTFDYDLPNDLVYGETCASIALAFFAQRMLTLDMKGEYGDVLDTLLYNGTISGMNLEGNRFFYVNPLESWPERSEKNQQFRHVKSVRQKWFGCACCPPNLARMISALPSSVYYTMGNTAYTVLYTAADARLKLDGGEAVLNTKTGYPWDGGVHISVSKAFKDFTLALRLPGWVKTYTLTVNGKPQTTVFNNGFLYIDGLKDGDSIDFNMDMPVRVMRARPDVRQDIGKAAIVRGPIVYCLEEADNGKNLSAIALLKDSEFTAEYDKELLGGIVKISCAAKRLKTEGWDEYELYADHEPVYTDTDIRFVPYYAWNNRGEGEMTVWVREAR